MPFEPSPTAPDIQFYQRILDRADPTGRAQFVRDAEDIILNSRPGGPLRSRYYWGLVKRYRARIIWRHRMTDWCGSLFMDGWQAAERYHGIETQGRR